jgi:hypothetical protein
VRCTARKGSASSSKQRELSRQRYAIAAEAIEEGAATVAEIARRLHRSEAAISSLGIARQGGGNAKNVYTGTTVTSMNTDFFT